MFPNSVKPLMMMNDPILCLLDKILNMNTPFANREVISMTSFPYRTDRTVCYCTVAIFLPSFHHNVTSSNANLQYNNITSILGSTSRIETVQTILKSAQSKRGSEDIINILTPPLSSTDSTHSSYDSHNERISQTVLGGHHPRTRDRHDSF